MVFTQAAGAAEGERTTRWFADEASAQEFRDEVTAQLNRLNTTTIGTAVDLYRAHLADKGTVAVSHKETTRRLKLFFPDLALPVSRITPERARNYYEAFRKRLKPNGEPISVDYHRCTLINARSFCKWAMVQGWLSINPFVGVDGIGRRSAGKMQHTGNETRKLYAWCLARAGGGDDSALGVLMALLMALRSSDITRRLVRDVDLDVTVLRVSDGKTRKSNRPRLIPGILRPMLARLVTGRDPFAPLFQTPYTESGHHTRRWLEEAMHRLCDAAGVPYVCPHALKGTAATMLAETGAAAEVIADHLSHEKVGTTSRHYTAPGAMEQAQAGRALSVIAGGRK